MRAGTTTVNLASTLNTSSISGANVRVDGGRLVLSASTSTASRFASDITNNGEVEMRYGGLSYNFGNVISGTGNFIKSGTADLTLSRANTYTGVTTI